MYDGSRARARRGRRNDPGVGSEQRDPTTPAVLDGAVDAFAADETLEVAVLDLDGGLLGPVGVESDLDLAGVRGVGVELPVAADLPGEHHPLRGLPGQHPAPVPLAAVHAALEPPAALGGFEDHVGDLGLSDVVLPWPPGAEGAGEQGEGAVTADVHGGLALDRR